MTKINRREFIKLFSVNLGVYFIEPFKFLFGTKKGQSLSRLADMPKEISRILERVPLSRFDENGYLHLVDEQGKSSGKVKLERTKWNKKHINPKDKLHIGENWGIVLHWFGDKDNHNLKLPGYMAGFNGDQIVDDQVTQTSSHFLIGDDQAVTEVGHNGLSVGIIQTQAPAAGGKPYVSSHLLETPYKGVGTVENYFMKATNELAYGKSTMEPILTDLFQRPNIDPNLVTISVEITGFDFDHSEHYPGITTIANVVSVVVAIMKRYKVTGINILGHHEFDLEKSDPGKNFLGLIRMLVGLLALQRNDHELIELVFGQFIDSEIQFSDGITEYFQFIRDYLLLVSDPAKVFVFEGYSKYLLVRDELSSTPINRVGIAGSFDFPLKASGRINDLPNLASSNHAGLDVGLESDLVDGNKSVTRAVQLIGNGKCIYVGESKDGHWGKTIMFRHRLVNASEIISIYANLLDIEEFVSGDFYQKGRGIGRVAVKNGFFPGFLHFSIAYGGTWETDLESRPFVPSAVSPKWIRQRFMDPIEFYNGINANYVREVDWSRLEKSLQE